MSMFRVMFCTLMCLIAPTVHAYGVTLHEVTEPYEIVTVPGIATEQHIIAGTLNDYPQMVEVTSDESFLLSVALRAVPGESTPEFGGIVVRVLEPRGVAEVARLKSTEATWSLIQDPVSALSYREGPMFQEEVPAGTYRIEVSTPANTGQYMVVVGANDSPSTYGETWTAVRTLYDFYGVSKIGMIRSPLVYYPLGILLLLLGFGYTIYRTRSRLPFLTKHA